MEPRLELHVCAFQCCALMQQPLGDSKEAQDHWTELFTRLSYGFICSTSKERAGLLKSIQDSGPHFPTGSNFVLGFLAGAAVTLEVINSQNEQAELLEARANGTKH